MRTAAYILITIALILLGCAIRDEVRGTTHHAYDPIDLRHRNNHYYYRISIARQNNPELFRRFMNAHWIYVGVFAAGGVIVWLIAKNLEED